MGIQIQVFAVVVSTFGASVGALSMYGVSDFALDDEGALTVLPFFLSDRTDACKQWLVLFSPR